MYQLSAIRVPKLIVQEFYQQNVARLMVVQTTSRYVAAVLNEGSESVEFAMMN